MYNHYSRLVKSRRYWDDFDSIYWRRNKKRKFREEYTTELTNNRWIDQQLDVMEELIDEILLLSRQQSHRPPKHLTYLPSIDLLEQARDGKHDLEIGSAIANIERGSENTWGRIPRTWLDARHKNYEIGEYVDLLRTVSKELNDYTIKFLSANYTTNELQEWHL